MRVRLDLFVIAAFWVAPVSAHATQSITDLETLPGTSAIQADGVAPNDQMGTGVGSVGDVNCDGVDDFAFTGRTGIRVIYGSASPTAFTSPLDIGDYTTAPGYLITGVNASNITSGELSRSIAPLGDIDNSGCEDFAVGLPQFDTARNGAVLIVLGQSQRPQQISLSQLQQQDGGVILRTYREQSWFGQAISHADHDGDEQTDLIVGAFYDGGHDYGRAYIVYGDFTSWAADPNGGLLDEVMLDDAHNSSPEYTEIEGHTNNGHFGWSISGIGEFDSVPGDEVAVGAYGDAFFDAGLNETLRGGSVYVFGYTGSRIDYIQTNELEDYGARILPEPLPQGTPLNNSIPSVHMGWTITALDNLAGNTATDMMITAHRMHNGASSSEQFTGAAYIVNGSDELRTLAGTGGQNGIAEIRVDQLIASAGGRTIRGIYRGDHLGQSAAADPGSTRILLGTRRAPDTGNRPADRRGAWLITLDRCPAGDILLGAPQAPDCATHYSGEWASDYAGSSVAFLADSIGADGLQEAAVGAFGRNARTGRVYILHEQPRQPQCVSPPRNVAFWYQGTTDLTDVIGGLAGTQTGAITQVAGRFGGDAIETAVNGSATSVTWPADANAATAGGHYTVFVRFFNPRPYTTLYALTFGRPYSFNILNRNRLNVWFHGSTPQQFTVAVGEWIDLALVQNGAGSDVEVYIDGIHRGSITGTGNMTSTSSRTGQGIAIDEWFVVPTPMPAAEIAQLSTGPLCD